jgi:hypothetical protein
MPFLLDVSGVPFASSPEARGLLRLLLVRRPEVLLCRRIGGRVAGADGFRRRLARLRRRREPHDPSREGNAMTEVDALVASVELARNEYLSLVKGLSPEQAGFRADGGAWSIAEITEHLVHAELGGINLIWRAADGVARGTPVWSGETPHRGLGIEAVIQRTWRERESAPDSALPRVGGPLAYWVAALRSCSPVLAALTAPLRAVVLEDTIYPHAISGPLDARQRLEFLAFHLRRHAGQVAAIMRHANFPQAAPGLAAGSAAARRPIASR